jgi:AcrR family transcriptional regulator
MSDRSLHYLHMSERSFIMPRGEGKGCPMTATTRQQILAAAAQVLRERGLVGMTTRTIARAAGLADGTLYVHFPHKEDLILAVIQEQLPHFTAAMQADPADPRPLAMALEGLIRAALRYTAALIPLSAALFADPDLLARQQDALTQRQAGPHLLYQRVAAYIMAEQQRGRINAHLNPLSVAALLLGPCFQYAFLRQFIGAAPLPMTEEEFVTGLVQTLIAGLAPSPAGELPTKDHAHEGEHDDNADVPLTSHH